MFRATTSSTMTLATVSSSAVWSLPLLPQPNRFRAQRPSVVVVCCESGSANAAESSGKGELTIGSPIIVVKSPPTLKTASPMPSLRVNSGLVKPGDVGRYLKSNLAVVRCFNAHSSMLNFSSEIFNYGALPLPLFLFFFSSSFPNLAASIVALIDGKHFKPLDVDE